MNCDFMCKNITIDFKDKKTRARVSLYFPIFQQNSLSSERSDLGCTYLPFALKRRNKKKKNDSENFI